MGCTLTLPATAQAGQFFTASWTATGSGAGTITRRSDDTVVASVSGTGGDVQIWATNVLGPHSYLLKFQIGNDVSRATGETVFEYTPAAVDGYDIIIVAGQSNAPGAGHGNSDGYDADENASPELDAKIVQLGRIGQSNRKVVPVGYWQGGKQASGLHFWERSEGSKSVSFCLTFARLYALNYLASGRKVLIVPAGMGGTSITQWLVGGPDADPPLYHDMISRTNAALRLRINSKVVAFLWQQGERDSKKAQNNSSNMNKVIYKRHLLKLWGRVRRHYRPEFPIIAGLLAPHWVNYDEALTPYATMINEGIIAATEQFANAAYVDTDELLTNAEAADETGADPHFCAASQVTLGARYFEQYQLLRGDG